MDRAEAEAIGKDIGTFIGTILASLIPKIAAWGCFFAVTWLLLGDLISFKIALWITLLIIIIKHPLNSFWWGNGQL